MKEPFNLEMNVPCAQFTTLKIGGPARYFIRAETEAAVAEALEFADSKDLPVFVLGGGSNVLISDAGFDGLVLQIAITGSDFRAPNSKTRSSTDAEPGTGNMELVTAGAGKDWDNFVKHCVENDLAGVECLSGIPGLVGGTPVQNVGAYGQEVADTVSAVRCLDRRTRKISTLNNADCGFSYRTSIFNSSERDRFVVLSVTFALAHGGAPTMTYRDLLAHFGDRQASIKDVREAVLNIRRSKSMVIDDHDPNSRSAGSFFKNPIVSREYLGELRSTYERMPSFEFGERVKIPAAWLIENAGFQKGFVLGNAGISSNHTLAIINRGGASAAEVMLLKDEIQEAVKGKFGILLQSEPVFIGF